ncbi:SLBB domain-containing protein (plasmid) [Aliirhizobium terrae]|uniref:SLBB domain-containing protein n=1 Tax=Terrirhizobium terrae TaxID=2926709 RepID=UPI002574E567|nr:SLBB domain-containing protein [Rhizobium sp. CC-CFT758]WJH38149.1 SLBB domain-containing protein [Rhizobium sp. CC-CFT758]
MKLSGPALHAFFRATCRKGFAFIALALIGGIASAVRADGPPFTPQTKIRMTIVQWLPAKGEYERWDALGGEFTVSDDGELILPFLGSLSVGNLDSAGLTSEIAKHLQEKIGLVRMPAVTIEILDYPPIYVVGDVTRPGEYKFRPGLTVLQSLAMGGGPSRATGQQGSQVIRLGAELKDIDNSLLRSAAKLSRLQAEMTGAEEIAFEPPIGVDQQYARGIYEEEKVIAQARENALKRQSNALTELRDLLTAEISTLEEKLKGSDENIKSAEEQLAIVRTLVEKGAAVASRQLDLERLLTTYRSDRLDLVTAIMRGRQAISETTRNLEGLHDTQRSEIATEIQSEKAAVDQLKLKREMTQKLLVEELSSGGGRAVGSDPLPLTFSVSRRDKGKVNEFQASETTALVPGDVVRVIQLRSSDNAPASETGAVANIDVTQQSQ